MPWISVIGSVAGGLMSAGAAGDAADAQSAAAGQASGLTKEAQAWNTKSMLPWTNGGVNAQNALLRGLGVAQDPRDLAVQLLTRNARAGNPELSSNWVPNESDVQAYMRANPVDSSNDPGYGALTRKFNQADLDSDLVYKNTYQTALDTGVNALNSRAANSGNWGSGAALKALTRFGGDTAAKYTGDAYSRNMGEKQQQYNFLSGVSQQGQNAAAGVGASGMSAANTMGNNALQAGNAQSAGIIGGANAINGGIAGATNAYQWNQLMSKPKASYGSTGLSNSWDIPMQAGGGY